MLLPYSPEKIKHHFWQNPHAQILESKRTQLLRKQMIVETGKTVLEALCEGETSPHLL